MCKREESIEGFINYFSSQISQIENIQPLLYRKILYSTALDPLAKAAYGVGVGPRKRILSFIRFVVEWEHCDRISLPQLMLIMEDKGIKGGALFLEVQKRLSTWPSGCILRLSNSPKLNELSSFAATSEKKILNSCRYDELFYTHRNNLIHEFREPGYGIEMSDDGSEPYYHSMIGSPWQLVFPIGFFEDIYLTALQKLGPFLRKNKIDPMDQFEFGSRWKAN